MLEYVIEGIHRRGIEKQGGKSLKWMCEGYRGVPDRIDLLPIKGKRHKEIVAKYIQFTELKTAKGRLSKQQELRHSELRNLGFTVNVKRG